MADGRRLENRKNRNIAVLLSIIAKFGMMTHFDHLHHIDRYSAD